MAGKPVPVPRSQISEASAAQGSVIRLSAHGMAVEIDPLKGGRIDAASFKGKPVLYPRVRRDDPNPLDAGCFPLVPFSNRIRGGRFRFAGRDINLANNWDGDPHAIHGEGWLSAWQLVRQANDEAVLQRDGSPWWPWPYACTQTIRLAENTLHLSLALTNTGATGMPAGLGFHPYFPRTSSTRLQFEASAVWPPLSSSIAAAEPLGADRDFSRPKTLSGLHLDHCFEGWPGRAVINQPDLGFDLEIEAANGPGVCVVFVPERKDFFCFEPVTHLTDAVNLPEPEKAGLRILGPGETMNYAIIIAVAERG